MKYFCLLYVIIGYFTYKDYFYIFTLHNEICRIVILFIVVFLVNYLGIFRETIHIFYKSYFTHSLPF